jgi:hypothetical protein
VIHDFVRYPVLPLQFLGNSPPQVYKERLVLDRPADFFALEAGKDANKYLFQYTPDYSIINILSKEDLLAAKAAVDVIPKNSLAILGANANPGRYCSFITPTTDLLFDYTSTGVKILTDIPVLAAAGGRRRKTRSRKVKKSKKTRKTRARRHRRT